MCFTTIVKVFKWGEVTEWMQALWPQPPSAPTLGFAVWPEFLTHWWYSAGLHLGRFANSASPPWGSFPALSRLLTEPTQMPWDGWMASWTQWTLSLSKLWEVVKDRGAWHAVVHGVATSQTWLSSGAATAPRVAGVSLAPLHHAWISTAALSMMCWPRVCLSTCVSPVDVGCMGQGAWRYEGIWHALSHWGLRVKTQLFGDRMSLKWDYRDFSGGPLVGTLNFHRRGHRFDP